MEFVVYMDPIGKARPRFTKGGQTYTSKKTRRAEAAIRRTFVAAGGHKLEKGVLVAIYVTVIFPIPKSYSKKRAKACMDSIEQPTKKPDADNILKLVMDALNGVAYEDDRQVVDAGIHKRYPKNRNAEGCITIRVEESKV